MEPETNQPTDGTQIEKHYGKHVALVIVGVLAVVAIIYGAVSLNSGAGKTTYVALEKNAEIPAVATAAPVAEVPSEAFVVTDMSKTTTATITKTTSITTATKALASPLNFKSFTYDATKGKIISVSGTCHDVYYALLIFESKDDYRTSPGSARSNRAFECGASRLFTINMDLRDINLPSGNYYLFVADQGKTGSWYNPR